MKRVAFILFTITLLASCYKNDLRALYNFYTQEVHLTSVTLANVAEATNLPNAPSEIDANNDRTFNIKLANENQFLVQLKELKIGGITLTRKDENNNSNYDYQCDYTPTNEKEITLTITFTKSYLQNLEKSGKEHQVTVLLIAVKQENDQFTEARSFSEKTFNLNIATPPHL